MPNTKIAHGNLVLICGHIVGIKNILSYLSTIIHLRYDHLWYSLTHLQRLPPSDLPHTPTLIIIELPCSGSPPPESCWYWFPGGHGGGGGGAWQKDNPLLINSPIYWLLSRHRSTAPPRIYREFDVASKTMWGGTCSLGYKHFPYKWEIPRFVHLFDYLIWKRGRGEYRSFIPPYHPRP